MSKHVDGFVLPVPKAKLQAYRKLAELAGSVWREYGAIEYVECIADDVKPGKCTSFPWSVQLNDDETVVYAWIVYALRAKRDRINELAMKDPRLAAVNPQIMRFDSRRLLWGGFKVLVKA